MPDVPPGTQKPDSTWGGTWTGITREEYNAAIDAAGGLKALQVFESCTRPNGEDRVYTAWGRRDRDDPLVASEFTGCAQFDRLPYAECEGNHAFLGFSPWPHWGCEDCLVMVRAEQPADGEPPVACEDCGATMTREDDSA